MSALPMTVEAVFEDGVFRPIAPIQLAQNQRVRITVNGANTPREWPADTAEIYHELAAEDKRLADAMMGDIRSTWPADEDRKS